MSSIISANPAQGQVPTEHEDVLHLDGTKKKKKKPTMEDTNTQHTLEKENQLIPVQHQLEYSYQELLERLISLQSVSSGGDIGTAKPFRVPAPVLARRGARRTLVTNFADLCRSLNRPSEHVMAYVQVELGSLVSLDGEGKQIVIRGRFQMAQIERVLRHYIREYVLCKVCKSSDTAMEKEKENRLTFVVCGSCNSKISVAAVKEGFKAQIGRRQQQS